MRNARGANGFIVIDHQHSAGSGSWLSDGSGGVDRHFLLEGGGKTKKPGAASAKRAEKPPFSLCVILRRFD